MILWNRVIKMNLFDRARSYVPGEKKMEIKFKLGPAKTKDNTDAIIFEISNRIYGKRLFNSNGDWTSLDWDLDGNSHFSQLIPNNIPIPIRMLAFVSSTGLVRFAIQGSTEESVLKNTIGMKHAPKFDVAEGDL